MIAPILAAVYSAVFTLLVGVVIARLLRRLRMYRRAHVRPDVLLIRDIGLFVTLGLTVAALLAVRALPTEVGLALRASEWWIILTSTPPTLALAYWVWVEFQVD